MNFFMYGDLLKCSWVYQDALMKYVQMMFIFKIDTLVVHTFLQFVLQCLVPIGQKSHQQQVYCHHLNFSVHSCRINYYLYFCHLFRCGRCLHDGCTLGTVHYSWIGPYIYWAFNRVPGEYAVAYAWIYLPWIGSLWIFLRFCKSFHSIFFKFSFSYIFILFSILLFFNSWYLKWLQIKKN